MPSKKFTISVRGVTSSPEGAEVDGVVVVDVVVVVVVVDVLEITPHESEKTPLH